MCRPESPLTTSNKALRELQKWLREQRQRTQKGYRALSVRAGCHATTLQRAASGDTVPKLQTVLNYAQACDASPEEARLLWKRARYEETRLARGRRQPAPRPKFIRDFVDLGTALVELYEKAGSPPLRTMEQRAGGYGSLPRSSAHRIVNKQAMPHGLKQFKAYLRACEVPEAEWPDWEAAWTRAWRHEKQEEPVALEIPTRGSATARALAGLSELTEPSGQLRMRELRYLADGTLYDAMSDSCHQVSAEVKRYHGVPAGRRRRGRSSPSSGRPAQGQPPLAIPQARPDPAPSALI